MKRIGRFCFCVVTAFAPAARATNGMRAIGIGPVQRSMGGANVGLPLDSAVTITNPAGMIHLSRRFDIAVTYLDCDVSYRAHSDGGMITNDNVRIASNTDSCYIPAVGMVWHLNDYTAAGLGAYGICGMGVDYKQNLYNNITYTKYQLMKIAPVIAKRVSEELSIGVALNLDYAMAEYEAGMPAEVAHDDGAAYGLGFTAGLLYEMIEQWSLGLAYESKQRFSDFRFNTAAGRDKLDFDQPQSVTVGLGFKPNGKFRAAFDVMWIDWPQTNGANMPAYSKNGSEAAAWNMNWDQQFVYKVGAGYDLTEKVTLRAGYSYGKNPLDSSRPFENISFSAIAEQHFTAGLGIQVASNLQLNLGLMYAPEVSLKTANPSQFIDEADIEMSRCAVDVGVTYFF